MYDSILAKSPSIIYKPGGVTAGLVVTTWAQVQAFIALRQGAVIIYVDDSIVSPALVPGASGVTDCGGRVEFRPAIVDSLSYSVLQVDDGATLHNVYAITDVEVRCNSQSATPSLSFSGTPTGGTLILQQFGALTMAATATQPGIRVPAGTTMLIQSLSSGVIAKETFVDFTVSLFDVPVTASLSLFEFEGSLIFNNFASGAGSVSLGFDNTTAAFFVPPGTPPALPGITGAYSTFDESILFGDVTGKALTSLVVAWRNKALDPVTMAAPAPNDVPHWDGAKWVSAPAPTSPTTLGAIIYQPGVPSAGDHVATWPEVQTFIAATGGKCIVYVDDSIVSPAPVSGATGITDCKGRVELRAAKNDAVGTSVLQIQDGATLRDLSIVRGLEVQCDTRSPTRALDFTSAGGGNLLVKDFGAISNAATATSPAAAVAAGLSFFLNMEEGSLILNASLVPFFSIPATASLELFLLDSSTCDPGYASGAGDVLLNYDGTSARFFTPNFVPPALPGITGTYHTINVDSDLPNPGPQAQATWFIDPQNVTGLASDDNSGIDASHPVLSYNFGVARKWKTYSPMLRQNTTLTWLSSQVGNTDPVIFTPIMVGAVATLQGSLGAAQQIHAGNLAGVVAKNRATGQLLEADLGFAAPIGSLVQNTQAGKSSYAWVYKNVAGTVFALTQPMVPATMPFDFTTPITEVDTWANGDTFVVFTPIDVDFVDVQPMTAEFPATFAAPVQTYHLHGISADGVSGDANFQVGTDVSIVECSFDSVVFFPHACDDLGVFWSNDFFGSGVQGQSFGYTVQILGGAIVVNPIVGNAIITFSVDNDTIVDGTGAAAFWISSASIPALGTVYITGSSLAQGDFPARLATIWGPGSLDIIGASRCFYTAARSAVATFLNTGGLLLNGQANANAFDPTTGLWSTLIPITAANLDLAFGAGGFGGLATNVGGASFSSQAFP